MARIRTIKPDFWKHEDLSELPEFTHMLAAALLNHADDEGYFNANPSLVKSECLPLRESSVSVQTSLQQLAEIGFIQVGKGSDGKRYGRVVKFDEHQRVNRPTPSKIKGVGIVWEVSCTAHAQLSEDSPPEGKGREGKGKEGKEPSPTAQASSPSLTLTGDSAPPADLKARKAHRIRVIAEDAQRAYNANLAKPAGLLSACAVLNKPRLKAVEKALPTIRVICLQQFGGEKVTPAFWNALFETAADDDFHAGRGPYRPPHENWRPDFEYLLREEVITKLFERAMSRDAA